jgi:hypothetical protein
MKVDGNDVHRSVPHKLVFQNLIVPTPTKQRIADGNKNLKNRLQLSDLAQKLIGPPPEVSFPHFETISVHQHWPQHLTQMINNE